MTPYDDEPKEERRKIVAMLRNLDLFFEIGRGGGYIKSDLTSEARETLICHFAGLSEAIPTLPIEERKVIALVGLLGLTERQAARSLGESNVTVHRRLWSAASRIQKFWQRRVAKGGSKCM